MILAFNTQQLDILLCLVEDDLNTSDPASPSHSVLIDLRDLFDSLLEVQLIKEKEEYLEGRGSKRISPGEHMTGTSGIGLISRLERAVEIIFHPSTLKERRDYFKEEYHLEENPPVVDVNVGPNLTSITYAWPGGGGSHMNYKTFRYAADYCENVMKGGCNV